MNVNNNCSTGSTALFLARQAIASGVAECVLAFGFEQMKPGAIASVFTDRPSPFDDFDKETDALVGMAEIPLALRYFGGAGLAHIKQYGTKLETFAKVRAKASRHATKNPLALFKKEVTAQEVMDSPALWPGVLTRLMACPPTCGGAAAILVSEDFAKKHGLKRNVEIAAQAMTTDVPSSFGAHDMRQLVGFDMAKAAAKKVYEQAGIGPDELDVVELHDCFAQNELLSYEALGLLRCMRTSPKRSLRSAKNGPRSSESRRNIDLPARFSGHGASFPPAGSSDGTRGERRRVHRVERDGSPSPAS